MRRPAVPKPGVYNPDDYPHPGAALLTELEEIGLSQRTFAKYIGVSEDVIQGLCSCQIAMTPVLACKIGCALGSRPREWMELQINYDLVRVDEAEYKSIKPLGEYSDS